MKLQIINNKKANLYVSIQSPGMIELSKRLEGYRRWNPTKGFLTLEPTGYNMGLLRKAVGGVLDIQGEEQQRLSWPRTRREYSQKTPPYPYQKEALSKALNARKSSKGFALWCDPGTGKSKIAIDYMCEIYCRGEIDVIIVIAPKGVHRQWAEDQIPIHCGAEGWSSHWWYPGRKAPWINWFEGGLIEGPPFYCINYDALKTTRGEDSIDWILNKEEKTFGLVIDESHFVKNYRSQRWKVINRLGSRDNCMARLLLSGTPITKQLEDEWAQFRIADENILGIRYVTHFRNNYCIMGGYNGREFIGPRNLKKYRQKTSPFIFRATKDQLEGLPDQVYQRWHFSMTPGQKDTYDTLRKKFIVDLKDGNMVEAPHIAAALMKLQQISNGFVQPNITTQDTKGVVDKIGPVELMHATRNPRLMALKELLDTFGKNNPPVIIWCRFRWDVETIVRELSRVRDTRPLYGAVKDTDRQNNISAWLSGEAQILVATPGTGGTGLNLQGGGCNHSIYYSNSEHYTHRIQSENRIHRIGSTGDQTFYWDLVARGSRDMAILANLRKKKSLSDLVLDDIVKELEDSDSEIKMVDSLKEMGIITPIAEDLQALLES